jgi:hypothetical protein
MSLLEAAKSVAAAVNLEEKAEGILKAVLGPPAKELGDLWKDRVSARRFRNLVQIAAKAKEQLEAAGLTPKEVPLAIIHPLLQSASVEEEEDLQKRWAALLANACAGAPESQMLRSFVDILKQLSSPEAKFLDRAYRETLDPARLRGGHFAPPERYPILEGTLALLRPSMIANLERLGVITRQSHNHQVFTSSLGTTVTASANRLYVSDLGMEFVCACRPPAENRP